MKQGKKLTLKMKKFLENEGLNSKDYLVERKTSKEIGFIHKETGKVIYFNCDGGKIWVY